MENQSSELRKYFLGLLSQEESESLEYRMLEDEDFEAELALAQEELVEDFLDERLTENERTLFLNNYLVTDARREDVDLVRKLRALAARENAAAAGVPEKGVSRGFLSLFRSLMRPAFAVVLVLLVAAAAGWFLLLRPGSSELDRQVAELNRQDLSDLARFGGTGTLSLAPGMSRAGGDTAALTRSQGQGNTLIRLALPSGLDSRGEFDITFERDGRAIFTLRRQKAYPNGPGSDLRILVPAGALSSGDYGIRVKSTGSDAAAVTYAFRAE